MLALRFFPAPDRKTEIPKVRRSEFWWLLFFAVAMFALYAFAYWLGPPNPFVPAKAGDPDQQISKPAAALDSRFRGNERSMLIDLDPHATLAR
jgi:drug/metabolite transporter (DMT)-like permease